MTTETLLKRTPLGSMIRSTGGSMGEEEGWEICHHGGSAGEEALSLDRTSVLADWSFISKVAVRGPEAPIDLAAFYPPTEKMKPGDMVGCESSTAAWLKHRLSFPFRMFRNGEMVR